VPVVPVGAGLLLGAPNGLGAGDVVAAPNALPPPATPKPEEGRPNAEAAGCPNAPVDCGFEPNTEGGCAAGVAVCPAGVDGVAAGCCGCWPKEKPVVCLEGSFGLLRNAADTVRGETQREGRGTHRAGWDVRGKENKQFGDWRRKYVKQPGGFGISARRGGKDQVPSSNHLDTS
jgi:hypothetical protein